MSRVISPGSPRLLPAIWLTLAALASLPCAGARAQTTSACDLAMPAASFEELLDGCPRIGSHVVWEDCDGTRTAFDRWPAEKKARIGEIFGKLAKGERDLGLRCADPEKIKTGFRMYLTAPEAFDVYAAHVAHVFYVESRRLVPWSITARSGPELDELLSSDRYHSRMIPSQDSYPPGIRPDNAFQQPPRISDSWDTVCDPRTGFAFLSGKNASDHLSLIGRDERETLENITAWMYANVGHGDTKKSASGGAAQGAKDPVRQDHGHGRFRLPFGRGAVLRPGQKREHPSPGRRGAGH
jgi:hypothetical protein